MGQITKNVRSRDQFKKYETETRSLRDQDQDRQQKAETETETETETLKIGLETGLETKTCLETFITGRDPPSRPSIRLWHKKFMETGTVFDTRRSGRPRTFEENIELERQAFQRSSMKSIRTAARQLELPHSTVHKVSFCCDIVQSLT